MSIEQGRLALIVHPAAVLVLAAAFAYPLCDRGIVLSDEGLLLRQAEEIASGSVLYRDQDAYVAPGAWYLLAGLFRLFKADVLVGRIATLVLFAAFSALISALTGCFAPSRARGVAVITFLVLYVWAFPHWTWPLYSQFSVFFCLLATYCAVGWTTGARRLLAAGAMAGVAAIFKQNYGMYTCVALGTAVLAEPWLCGVPKAAHRGGRNALVFACGVLLPLLAAVGYFAAEGALGFVYDSLVLHPLQKLLPFHRIPYLHPAALILPQPITDRFTYMPTLAWEIPETPLRTLLDRWTMLERGAALLYTIPIPLFICEAALITRALARGHRAPELARRTTLLLVAVSTFVGTFPRADFAHLMNVYQPVLVLAVTAGYRVLQPLPRGLAGAVAAPVIVVGLGFAAIAIWWYSQILLFWNTPTGLPRAAVRLRADEALELRNQVRWITTHTRSDEAVLTAPDLVMLNFLSERPLPSRYYNLYPSNVLQDGGRSVVAASEASGLRLVVIRAKEFPAFPVRFRDYAPALWNWLDREFVIRHVTRRDQLIYLWRRHGSPKPETKVDLLSTCRPDQRDPFSSRTHGTLFSRLAQIPGPSGAPRRTECRVKIPAGSTFEAEVVVLPLNEDSGASVSVRLTVVAHSREHPRAVLTEQIIDGHGYPAGAWALPSPHHVHVDLSHFAGQRLTLELAAELVEPARTAFAVEWWSPRLVGHP
jgi:hypothetical protein